LETAKFAYKRFVVRVIFGEDVDDCAFVHHFLQHRLETYLGLRPVGFEVPEGIGAVVEHRYVPQTSHGHPELVAGIQKFSSKGGLTESLNEV
jgi:hypothetical protein